MAALRTEGERALAAAALAVEGGGVGLAGAAASCSAPTSLMERSMASLSIRWLSAFTSQSRMEEAEEKLSTSA